MLISKILDHVYTYMEPVVTLLDLASALVILWGFIIGFSKLIHIEFFRSGSKFLQYQELRRTVGIYILLGLEFMVVSDLLHTIQESRDYKSVIILGALVVIRTVISFFLGKEMKEAAKEEKEFKLGLAALGNKEKEVRKVEAPAKRPAPKSKAPKK